MLGRLCVRHKPWISSITVFSHSLSAAHQSRFVHSFPIQVQVAAELHKRRHHSTACSLGGALNSGGGGGGAASIWHAILPSGREGGGCGCRRRRDERKPGEGSWNAAWDERPARWLHRADSAWLLFGVCSCLAPIEYWTDKCANPETVTVVDEVGITDGCDDSNEKKSCEVIESTERSGADFKVIGMLADGRCLFRAIAQGACMKTGEEVLDENHQRELADELRAQVVDELLKRREEMKWFVEGDFDAYIKQIQQPNEWGGEPELLMASHVLKYVP
ncbi:uncharacterized protein LOC123192404 isoform X2 [Mangifera indica]|uniref:uncharacterized protein LOC123192404 isoform X2 n=1 Tax=Mangifera indica TaxID=29780 RepID=UPI001CFA122F|nr:uncharacterized protein LOC123192404 isoform X2 [Mangifera indica]